MCESLCWSYNWIVDVEHQYIVEKLGEDREVLFRFDTDSKNKQSVDFIL